MATVLLLVFNIGGLVGLFVGARALIRNWRESTGKARASWQRLAALGVGVLLAFASVVFVYPLGDSLRIVGLPFTAAAFEMHNGQWQDFVGLLTAPAYLANAVFWFLCPQLVLRMVMGRKARVR